MIELLSPVGDFECLKAAVQNGADAVYFGSNIFSARAFASNFDNEELEKAINYAKIRGVKTHLTLNTLIKNNEFEQAFNLAKKAYKLGIDAIIVQDLGLATDLIKSFPDLDIHASTQMTTTNLETVKKLEKIGFKRIVLSRECSLSEIKNICKNTNAEIEVFAHGALCICYSGQCLFSSMVGGRSGNRGMCAQPCRLPYSLLSDKNEKSKEYNKGYLLSTRDLCTLDLLPELISAGITSLKIEGRMKSPTYVATVTRIYKKYIDLATRFIKKEISEYIINENDKQALLQVFNRGNFSSGHLKDEPNKKLIFKEKPNNLGIYIGKVVKFSPKKGLITCNVENPISIGDSVSFENESTKYTISELMEKNINIKTAKKFQTVTFGRMKGNIKVNDKIYKITDKSLLSNSLESYNKEYKKTSLDCKLKIKNGQKIEVYVKSIDFMIENSFIYDFIPNTAQNAPLTIDKVKNQFNKTLNTCFEFSNIKIDLDNDLFIPTSILNDIRRQALAEIEGKILKSFKRTSEVEYIGKIFNSSNIDSQEKVILLNELYKNYNYSNLKNVDKIYLPLKYFVSNDFTDILNTLSHKGKLYLYMPFIIKDKYIKSIRNCIENIVSKFNICGFVISEYSSIDYLKMFNKDVIANYNFNVYNSYTLNKLKSFGFSNITLSPEFQQDELMEISDSESEVIVYGKIPLMTMSYCLLGKSNMCYKECKKLCKSDDKFFLNDRYNFKFRVIPDNMQTLTTIYNSRNIELYKNNPQFASLRFDFLDETIEEINKII